MNRKIRGFAAMLLLVMLCAALGPVALAEAPSVTVDVSLTLSGTLPEPEEKYGFVIEAKDASFPMPKSSKMTITGAGKGSFGKIVYEKVGVYEYTIRQVAGKNESCTYDMRVYKMLVYVTNKEGGGLETTVVLHVDGETDKPDNIVFANKYRIVRPATTPKPTPAPTGVEDKWPTYALASVAMLAVGAAAFVVIRKNNKDPEDEFDTVEEE